MDYLTVSNATQLTDKKFLASYVHDAAEIESAIYALKKLEKRLRKEISNQQDHLTKLDNAVSEHNKATKQLQICQKDVIESKKRLQENETAIKNKKMQMPLAIIATVLLFLPIITFIVILPLFFVALFFTSTFWPITLFLIFPVFLILLYLAYLFCRLICGNKLRSLKNMHQSLQRTLREHEKNLSKCEKECESLKNNLEELRSLQNGQETKEKIKQLTERLQYVQAQREKLEQKATVFYGMNVIPPDYRHPDCVMMLDRFFKNDLVNTMQEAVLYYDHKVEIGEIMKGFDNILHSINTLNGTMQSVAQRLRQIDDTVFTMHQELADKLDKQVDESQAARYATEHLEKTNQKILFYQEQDYIKNL